MKAQVTGSIRTWEEAASHSNSPRAVTTKIGTWFPVLRPAWRRLKLVKGSVGSPPGLDHVLDRNRVDVVHFPFQEAFDTSRPYIYQPWDLQHLHLPEFFTQETIARRESEYRKHVARSSRVIVASEWTRRDLIQRYDVSAEKVSVVNVPPVNSFYPPTSEAAIARVRDDYALPERYFLYPAQTYPHKNHLALVEAIALAKSRGDSIFVVCSGNRTDHYPSIRKLAEELKVDDRLVFVGFVDEANSPGPLLSL